MVRPLTGDGLVTTDGELLRLFTRHGDTAAFDKLVERHAPMVWRVCRQSLRRRQDAEDAFQATFLLLVKSARQIGASESAAGWLFRVAYRTSLRARKRLATRREEALALDPEAPSEEQFPDLSGRQTVGLLAEELMELPLRYQTPLVMRYLEGQSRRAIAEATDVTVATVQGRLARGKQLLRRRLVRRGVSLSVAMGALTARNANGAQASAVVAPAQVILQTTSNATALVTGGSLAASAVVVTLIEQGTRAMLFASLTKPAAVTAACGLAALVLAAPPIETPTTASEGVVLSAAVEGDDNEAPTATLELAADEPTSGKEPEASAPGVAAAPAETSEDPLAQPTPEPLAEAPLDAEQYKLLRKQWAEAAKAEPVPTDGKPSFEELHTWYTYWKLRSDALRKRAEDLDYLQKNARRAGTAGEIQLIAADLIQARAEVLRYERELKMRALNDGMPEAPAPGREAPVGGGGAPSGGPRTAESHSPPVKAPQSEAPSTAEPIDQIAHDLDESLRQMEESGNAANRLLTVSRSVEPAMAGSLYAAAANYLESARSHRNRAAELLTAYVGEAALKDQKALRAAEIYSRRFEDTKQQLVGVFTAYNERNQNTSTAGALKAAPDPAETITRWPNPQAPPAAAAPPAAPDPLLEWKAMTIDALMNPAGFGLSREDATWYLMEVQPNREESLRATIKINPGADAEAVWEAWQDHKQADKDREVRVITTILRSREAAANLARSPRTAEAATLPAGAKARNLAPQRVAGFEAVRVPAPPAPPAGPPPAKARTMAPQRSAAFEAPRVPAPPAPPVAPQSAASSLQEVFAGSGEGPMAEQAAASAVLMKEQLAAFERATEQLRSGPDADKPATQQMLAQLDAMKKQMREQLPILQAEGESHMKTGSGGAPSGSPRAAESTSLPAGASLTGAPPPPAAPPTRAQLAAGALMLQEQIAAFERTRAELQEQAESDAGTKLMLAQIEGAKAEMEQQLQKFEAQLPEKTRQMQQLFERRVALPDAAELASLREQNQMLRAELDALRKQIENSAFAFADSRVQWQGPTVATPAQPFAVLLPLDKSGRPGKYAGANQQYGFNVRQLQQRLNEVLDPSPKLDIDGDYGPQTVAAVKRLQTDKGFRPSGVADEPTRRAMGLLEVAPSPQAPTGSGDAPTGSPRAAESTSPPAGASLPGAPPPPDGVEAYKESALRPDVTKWFEQFKKENGVITLDDAQVLDVRRQLKLDDPATTEEKRLGREAGFAMALGMPQFRGGSPAERVKAAIWFALQDSVDVTIGKGASEP